jgi:hypothetical protein
MPDKITYEEVLVEKLTKATKEVIEQLNENSLVDAKKKKELLGEEQKVTRPKAENVSEKNPVGGELQKEDKPSNASVRNLLKAFSQEQIKKWEWGFQWEAFKEDCLKQLEFELSLLD